MFYKSLLLLVALSFSASNSLLAQGELIGTVVDFVGKPVVFAKIHVKNLADENITLGELTDEDGSFKIKIPTNGTYKVRISYVGFADWEQELSFQNRLDLGQVQMSLDSSLLGVVDVFGDRPVMERKEDKLIFNVQSSPLKDGYDGMEVLERSPTVWIEDGAIIMRNESATIMIDGRILNLSGGALQDYLRTIKSEDIDRIEIQEGISASEDGESSGGVINIILVRKIVGFSARFKSFYTFRDLDHFLFNSGIEFDYGSEKWNLYGGWSYTFDKDFSSTVSDINYFTSGDLLTTNRDSEDRGENRNYKLGLVMEPVKNHVIGIEAYLPNSNSIFGNVSNVVMSNEETIIDRGITTFDNSSKSDFFNTALNYSWKFDTLNSTLKFFGDYSNQSQRTFNEALSIYDLEFFPNINETNESKSNTEIYSVQTDLEKRTKKGLKIGSGLKYTNTARQNGLESKFLDDDFEWITDIERTTLFDYNEQILAGYMSLGKKIKEKNYLQVGLRVENTSIDRVDLFTDDKILRNYTNLLPSFYYSRTISKTKTFNINFSRRIRRPSFRLLNNNIRKINDFRFEIGNPNLNPEYINKLALGLNIKKHGFNAYFSRTGDVINGVYSIDDNNIAYYRKENSGAQTQVGFDYNTYRYIKEKWYVKLSTGVYHRFFTDSTGQNLFPRTTFYVSGFVNYEISETMSVDFKGYYISPKEDAYYVAAQRYKFDIILKKSFFDKKLNCRIYANDIFNTLIYENVRAFDDFQTSASEKPLTRSFSLWLTYTFTNNKANERRNESQNDAQDRL